MKSRLIGQSVDKKHSTVQRIFDHCLLAGSPVVGPLVRVSVADPVVEEPGVVVSDLAIESPWDGIGSDAGLRPRRIALVAPAGLGLLRR